MEAIRIARAEQRGEIVSCASWMAACDPWKRLGIDADALVASMSDPLRETHFAWVGTEVVGVVTLLMYGALRGYIQLLAVHPSRQGQGIGSRLLDFAEQRIFAEVPNVFICASSFNVGAQRLYERQGYSTVGQLTDYLVKGYAEILMRKSRGPILRGEGK